MTFHLKKEAQQVLHILLLAEKVIDQMLFFYEASLDMELCDCQVPCFQVKYHTEVSYSKFPDTGTADALVLGGYYNNVQYQR